MLNSKKLTGIYEHVEKFRHYKEAPQVQIEKEYNRRRKIRKKRSKVIRTDRKLYYYKKLYAAAGITVLIGIVVTFGSTIRSLGEGTFLWSQKRVFNIMGPTIIGVGTVITLVASGLVFQRREQVIEEKGLNRNCSYRSFNSLKRQMSQETSQSKRTLSTEISNDSNLTEYRFNKLQRSRSPDDSDMETFLGSSNSSTTSMKWNSLLKSPTERERPKIVRQGMNFLEPSMADDIVDAESGSSRSGVINENGEFDCKKDNSSTSNSFLESKLCDDILIPELCSYKQNGFRNVSYFKCKTNVKKSKLPVIITTDTNGNTLFNEASV